MAGASIPVGNRKLPTAAASFSESGAPSPDDGAVFPAAPPAPDHRLSHIAARSTVSENQRSGNRKLPSCGDFNREPKKKPRIAVFENLIIPVFGKFFEVLKLIFKKYPVFTSAV